MTDIVGGLASLFFYLVGMVAIVSLLHSAVYCFRKAGEIALELAGLEIVERDDA